MSSVILDKVRKLLAKTTEANCTEAEADGAMAAASRLLAQHNLSMADVVNANTPSAEVWTNEFTFRTGRWTAIHYLAYSIVYEFCSVRGVFDYSRGNRRRVKELYLFGLRDNVETAKFMFGALLSSFDHLWDNYRARTCAPLNHKFSYIKGVSDGFSDKMRASRQSFSLEQDILSGLSSGSTALVLTSVAEKTAIAYQKKYGKLKSTNVTFGVSDNSASARAAGYQAGQKLNINKGLGGKS